jgi:hypothetical protein
MMAKMEAMKRGKKEEVKYHTPHVVVPVMNPTNGQ